MRHEDDGVLGDLLAPPLRGQGRDERLRMLVDHITAGGLASKGRDIGVVAVDEDARLVRLERFGEQLGGPEDAIVGSPGVARMAIEPVD